MDDGMNAPPRRATTAERVALLGSAISGTVSYLLALREFQPWWIVAPVAFLALPIAMMFSAAVIQWGCTLTCRIIFLALGTGLLWTAANEEHRVGSAFMGMAVLILGSTARKAE
ncbi:MAG: hypothetical protein ACM3U2_01050 [Deltaproteobacteria bacterium]